MSSWSYAADAQQDQVLHYNQTKNEIVEPVSQLNLVTSTANPGGAGTIWMATNGDIMHGALPISGSSSAPQNLSATFQGFESDLVTTTGTITVNARLSFDPNTDMATLAVKGHRGPNAADTQLYVGSAFIPAGYRPNET